MKQTYFIDSENVNDLWVNLLDRTPADAELLVFYTKGSPHMSYASLRRLKESDREVTFIKCYEGTNALDFQLVTELGYRLRDMQASGEDCEMILVTNDNGFEAAVNYWKDRGFQVRRMNGQACSSLTLETDKVVAKEKLPKASEAEPTVEVRTEGESLPAVESREKEPVKEQLTEQPTQEPTEEQTGADATATDFPQEEMDTVIRCLGKKKLAELFNALVAIYGDKGKDYYAIVKPKSYKVEPQAWKLAEKFEKYTAIVFANSEEEEPEGFASFLYDTREKMKNLNSFRAACTKQYGKDKGAVYYTIIKPHVKWMAVMN